jgi:hypothetical protein
VLPKNSDLELDSNANYLYAYTYHVQLVFSFKGTMLTAFVRLGSVLQPGQYCVISFLVVNLRTMMLRLALRLLSSDIEEPLSFLLSSIS